MDCVFGSDRRNQFQEKMIIAYKGNMGYEQLTKAQQISYILNLPHKDHDVQHECANM